MRFGSVSSRRCARCGQVGTAQLSTGLCTACTQWQKNNPSKPIKIPAIFKKA